MILEKLSSADLDFFLKIEAVYCDEIEDEDN